MIYISKGIVLTGSTENNLAVERGGQKFNLTGEHAKLWLKGRYEFNNVNGANSIAELNYLYNMGLVEYEADNDAVSKYRILTRCICAAAVTSPLNSRTIGLDGVVLKWLKKAGLRLSVAELVFLQENKIEATSSLLGVENRQALVETIYTHHNIADNILECQMESAVCRDDIVKSVLSLLMKRKIILL